MEFNCEDWDIGKEASGLASSLFKKEQKKNKRKRKNEETNDASTESNVELDGPPVVSKKAKKATAEMPSAADRVSLIQQQLGGEEKLSKKERKNLRRKKSKLMRKLMNPAGTGDVNKKSAIKDKTKQTGPNSNTNSAENDLAVKKKSKGKKKEKRSINGDSQSGDNSNSKATEGPGGKVENNTKRKRDKKTEKTTGKDSSSLNEQSDSASQVTDSKSDNMNTQSSSPTNKKKRKRVSKKNKFKGYVKPDRKDNPPSTSESVSSKSSNKETLSDSDDGNNAAKSDDAQNSPKTQENKKKKRKKKISSGTETDSLDVNATITNGKQSDVSKSVDKKSGDKSVEKSSKRNSLDPKILNSILNPGTDKTALSPDDTDTVTGTMETGAHSKGQSFLDKSKERLNAARFRYLNEQLYTTTGKEAFQLFKYDKTAFDVYHEGFQSQVEKWPSNPIDIIIKQIQSKPKHLILADFGCGDAKLARSVQQKVHSFDLVALNDHVTVCDMSKVPVKDSTVDIAVFCLSLMGTNLTSYLKEANRVLKNNGTLIIAEVVSRFQSVGNFIMKVEKIGFKVKHQNSDNKMFVMMEFKKTLDCKNKDIEEIKLKPCVYKKR